MKSPYEILGVSPSATDDELKQAYRALAKKYHPDSYQDSPLADLASEKMSEINAAYDKILAERKNPYSAPFGQAPTGNYRNTSSGGSGKFSRVRMLINSGQIFEAEKILDQTAMADRDGEWYFLKGNILYSKGFLEDALNHIKKAVEMDPNNFEYQAAYNQMNMRRQRGYSGGNVSYSSCDPCSCCSTLICMNCLCNSFCRCCFCD